MPSLPNYLNPQYHDIIFQEQQQGSQIDHIALQKRIALFSDNGDDLCYIYQELTFSYGCVMNRALHSGLNSSIFV